MLFQHTKVFFARTVKKIRGFWPNLICVVLDSILLLILYLVFCLMHSAAKFLVISVAVVWHC